MATPLRALCRREPSSSVDKFEAAPVEPAPTWEGKTGWNDAKPHLGHAMGQASGAQRLSCLPAHLAEYLGHAMGQASGAQRLSCLPAHLAERSGLATQLTLRGCRLYATWPLALVQHAMLQGPFRAARCSPSLWYRRSRMRWQGPNRDACHTPPWSQHGHHISLVPPSANAIAT